MAIDPALALPAELTLADSWSHDSDTGLWTCGDVGIALEADDHTRYYVWQLDTGSYHLFGGRIPPSGYYADDFRAFMGHMAQDAANHDLDLDLPSDGLEPWFDIAQPLAEAEYEEQAAVLEAEREEFERGRVGRTAAELLVEVHEEPDWLVPGVLVRRWTHKFGGREKDAGKGTLVGYMLGKLERGEDTVFGPSCATATAVVLTEEPPDSIREKVEAFGLQRSLIIYGWELSGLPWKEKVTRLVREAIEGAHSIVFVDNVSRSAGIVEEGGVELARSVEILQDACTRAGLALIIDHHHKKGRDRIENKSRGGTALPGAVDVNIEIERPGRSRTSRKRRLTAIGRTRATNWVRVIELAENGREYIEVEDETDAEDDPDARREERMLGDALMLRSVCESNGGRVTVEQFMPVLGLKERATRDRLNALVRKGMADVIPGSPTATGHTPNIYMPKLDAEPAAAAGTNGSAAGADGSVGSKEPV